MSGIIDVDEAARSGKVVQIGRVRYRLVFRRQEAIVFRELAHVDLVANAQDDEGIMHGQYGAEWRPSASAVLAGGSGLIESRFVPWSNVAEVIGVRTVVLEYREAYEDRLRRPRRPRPDSEDIDRSSEDWSPLPHGAEAFEETLAAVLQMMGGSDDQA